MGSISTLYVAGYPVWEEKNQYIHEIPNLIFQPDDFITEKNKPFHGFRQSVKVCKQRLEIYGISLKHAEKDFDIAKETAIKEGYYDFHLSKIKYKDYLETSKAILEKKPLTYLDKNFLFYETLIEDELLFQGQTLEANLYSIFYLLKETDIVEYDLTYLIESGYINYTPSDFISWEKIIVLTEGKTDSEFLSKALKRIHPNLYPYYHFMAFAEFKAEGSTSALFRLVKSLAAANVKQPIVVIFDNDTAGILEMNKLEKIKLGENFRVLKYPDIEIAKNYPTIGPNGFKNMNVNGFACSIEMYFGKDTLSDSNGKLILVRWTSFMSGEKCQGKIDKKDEVQKKFTTKLNSELDADFSDIDSILISIFQAYRK